MTCLFVSGEHDTSCINSCVNHHESCVISALRNCLICALFVKLLPDSLKFPSSTIGRNGMVIKKPPNSWAFHWRIPDVPCTPSTLIMFCHELACKQLLRPRRLSEEYHLTWQFNCHCVEPPFIHTHKQSFSHASGGRSISSSLIFSTC